MGIPLELITMLGSGILGGVMTLWSQSMKSRQQQHERAIEGLSVRAQIIDKARKYNAPGFQFTRRLIALAAVAMIVVWPKLVPVFWPKVKVVVGYTEFNPGFLFFPDSESVTWQAIEGLVLTPLDTHLMGAIIGLYFGASTVKNAR